MWSTSSCPFWWREKKTLRWRRWSAMAPHTSCGSNTTTFTVSKESLLLRDVLCGACWKEAFTADTINIYVNSPLYHSIVFHSGWHSCFSSSKWQPSHQSFTACNTYTLIASFQDRSIRSPVSGCFWASPLKKLNTGSLWCVIHCLQYSTLSLTYTLLIQEHIPVVSSIPSALHYTAELFYHPVAMFLVAWKSHTFC